MATTEEVPPEPKAQPKIKEILGLLAPGGEIEQAEKKQADGMSSLGKAYQKIEKNMQGNRAAVSLIRRIQKMPKDKMADFIRTLEPLLVHFRFTLDDIDPDLVDQAGRAPTPNDDGGDEDDDDAEKEDEKGSNAKLSGLDKARQHLSGEKETPADVGNAFVKGASKAKLSIASPPAGQA